MPGKRKARYAVMVTSMMGYSPILHLYDELKYALDGYDELARSYENQKRRPQWLGEIVVVDHNVKEETHECRSDENV